MAENILTTATKWFMHELILIFISKVRYNLKREEGSHLTSLNWVEIQRLGTKS